jgi:hypothetical protein
MGGKSPCAQQWILLKLPVFSYLWPASCNLASNLSGAPASSLASKRQQPEADDTQFS